MRLPYTTEAISNLRPGSTWKLGDEDYDFLEWFPENSLTKPTKEEVEAEAKRLAAVAEANKYKLQRAKEYPPLAELADALYWQQNGDTSKMDAYLAKVDAVKEKYPKG
jgi:phosphoketolase